jgi:hypothetical protein
MLMAIVPVAEVKPNRHVIGDAVDAPKQPGEEASR